MDIIEIIGFDLGHGETAVAKAIVESIEPPQMLEINNQKHQITALGWHPRLGYLVGEQALIQAGVTQLKIAFKQKPNQETEYQETIRLFLSTCYRLLQETRQIEDTSNNYFYVGCPSGWSINERQDYQKLLQDAGVPQLRVVPESRAAFMQAKEAGKLEYDKLKSSVLIVDIGSSTTDFTLVKSLHEIPLDFGSNSLGASLIDRAIFERTLAEHEQKALLEKVFQDYPHHKARCELACRKAKEDYFSHEQLYSDPQSVARGFESINEQIFFIPQVNKIIMEEILNQPLKELGQKSWLQAFREAVKDGKDRLDKQQIIPKLVLMTGGASRMGFTRHICEEILNDPSTQVRPDPEPERCIALGLARVGRWDLRAAEFKQEVKQLFESKTLHELIEKQLPELIQLLSEPLAKGLMDNVITIGIKDWRNNKIRTLADLELALKNRAQEWLNSQQAEKLINQQCANWFNTKIQPELATQTDPICRKFQIPRSSLRFEEGIDPTLTHPELRIGDVLLADTVALLVNVIIGGGTLASLITLVMTGHFTLPIALIYGASLVAAGMEFNRKGVKDALKTNVDVPSWIRSSFLSDKKLENLYQQTKPELETTLKQQLSSNQVAFTELIDKVEQELGKILLTKVEEAIILIQ